MDTDFLSHTAFNSSCLLQTGEKPEALLIVKTSPHSQH